MTCSSAARWAVFKFLLLIGAITCTASSLEEPAVYQGDIFPELSSDIKEGCPEWLTEYAEWHKANKDKPDAKYIAQSCDHLGCAGLADRLRGSMFLLRVAAKTNRVFLFYHVDPEPLEALLAPNLIDWTVNMTLHPDIMKHIWKDCCEEQATAESSELMTPLYNSTDKYIVFSMNTQEYLPEPREFPISAFGRNASCIFRLMYRPSAEVQQIALRQYADMQVNPLRPYVAIHMRTGLLVGADLGSNVNHTIEVEDRAMGLMLCARKMARQCDVDLTVNPVVMVTDNVRYRRRVVMGLYRGMVASNIRPHHFDQAAGVLDKKTHMETIADMVVMSRASGLLVDLYSGFGRMASYMGGKEMNDSPCLRFNQDCDSSWHEEVNKDVTYHTHCICAGACTGGSSPRLATRKCLSKTLNDKNNEACSACCMKHNCPSSTFIPQ